jgi:hypothetical protein
MTIITSILKRSLTMEDIYLTNQIAMNYMTNMKDNLTADRRSPAGNRRLAKKRVQCLNDALCFVSSSVLAESLVLRNPLLRQAPKRYKQV